MRCGGVQPLSVDDEVAVVADLNAFAAEPDKAFDVKLVTGNAVAVTGRFRNSLGFEYDDLSAFGWAEIVSQPIDEKMVAGGHFHFHNVFAFAEELVGRKARALFERERAIIGREPNGIGVV